MRFLARKIGKLPLGIWFGWAGLAYAVFLSLKMAARDILPRDAFVLWPVTILAAYFLFRRRLIAVAFLGMAYALQLYDCVATKNIIGILLFPVCFICVTLNRRWFDDKLPRIG